MKSPVARMSISGQHITGVQSWEIQKKQPTEEDYRNFGQYSSFKRVNDSPETNSFSASWIASDKSPDRHIFGEGVNTNLLTNKYNFLCADLSGGAEVENSFLKSYSISVKPNSAPIISTAFDCGYVSFAEDFAHSITDGPTGNINVAKNADVTVSNNFQSSFGVNTTNFCVESLDLNVNISRKSITPLGSNDVAYRPPQLPVPVTLQFAVIKTPSSMSRLHEVMDNLKSLSSGHFNISLSSFGQIQLPNLSLHDFKETREINGDAKLSFSYFGHIRTGDFQL